VPTLAEEQSRGRASPLRGAVYRLAMDEELVPVLDVDEAARAIAWYGRLGFAKQWVDAPDHERRGVICE
jgi:hypothetical protein